VRVCAVVAILKAFLFGSTQYVFDLSVRPAFRQGIDDPIACRSLHQICVVAILRTGEPKPSPTPVFGGIIGKPTDNLRKKRLIAFGMIGPLANPRVKARMERYHPGIVGLE
jgi:hypothetical protein